MTRFGGDDDVSDTLPESPAGVATPGAAAPTAADHSLLAQFDRVVAERPDAGALDAGHQRLSYRELQSWSMQIAAELGRRLGPGDRPVATLIGHGPAAVAAMLGIARAGRPFTNLDPTLPDVRLEYMLAAADAAGILVTDAESEQFAGIAGDVPAIDVGGLLPGAVPGVGHPADVDPDAPACLLFTSGSTGRPKGIVWPQATLIKDARAGRLGLGIRSSDRIGLVMPVEFVAGLVVAVWGLTTGATVCMFDPRRHPIADLVGWIANARLTTLHATPTLLRAILRGVDPAQRYPDLRLVTTCGEPVTAADVRALRDHVGGECEFVNWTGSSEVGVLALRHVTPGEPLADGPISAGRAIDGVEVEIAPLADGLDGALRGEDTGRAESFGELIVASANIALGYCGSDADLDGRFTTTHGRRRYRTGDLATLGPSGELRLHGRLDTALKIHGYLVEPSEVESALLDADEVADAYVGADRRTGAPRLVAYVVPAAGHVLSVSRLRTELRARLPLYMVPPTIVQVTELPRTERGKIDQAALQAAHVQPLRPEARAPRTDLEIYIANIWRNVLGIREIGIDDDFFELGGDSLAVEEVLAELQKLGPDLPTAAFISSPTVAGLAAAAESGPATRLGGGVVEMRSVEGAPTLFCFAGAGGIALAFERMVRDLDLDLQVYGVQMHALEYRGIPDFSVNRAVARFLRTFPTLSATGPFVLVGHSYGGVVALEVARELRRHGYEVALLALVDTFAPSASSDSDAGSPGGSVARIRSEAERVWDAVPGDTAVARLIAIPRMLTAGPVRYRGIKHYGGFYNRGWVMQQLHRPKPYAGNAVVYVGESNVTDTDQERWQRVLRGSWALAVVPGDHHTVLREPFVQGLAADLRERIRGATIVDE